MRMKIEETNFEQKEKKKKMQVYTIFENPSVFVGPEVGPTGTGSCFSSRQLLQRPQGSS